MRNHPQFSAYAALVSVCFFWGTTYLGIRMALETFPPAMLVAVRFTLSGSILLLGAMFMGAHIPRGRELARSAGNGILLVGLGTGGLVWAETMIPSGLAALIITISPFWMVGLDALMPPRTPLHGPTLAGMAIGLGGAALLVGPGAMAGGAAGQHLILGFCILQVGCLSWSLGSMLQRRQETKAHPIVSGGVQQLAAGLAFIPVALFLQGPVHWSTKGISATLYLVTFGSIIGYSSYVFALDRLPVAMVSLYNYVNPLVAVFLGWVFYREPFGFREAAAMLIIFTGVAVVKHAEARRKKLA